MPYHIDWYLPHQVSDARIWGHLSLEELELYTDTCVRMLAEAQAQAPGNRVHIIIDMLDAESIPPLYLMASQGVRVLKFKNRGTMFLLVQNTAVRSVMEITSHVMGVHFPMRIFKERQAALDALAAYLAKEQMR